MSQFFFRALPVITAKDATMDFEQLTFALNNGGQIEVNEKGELKLIKEAGVGAWTKLTLSAKIEESAGFETVRVRTEGAGAVARLRGLPKVKAAEEVKAAELFATLPVGFRPANTVVIPNASGGGFNILQIKSNGEMVLEKAATAGQGITFDGITFNLT